jgi:hypothetical protein
VSLILVFILGCAVGALVEGSFQRIYGDSTKQRSFHPVTRTKRALKAITPSRKSHTREQVRLKQDERRYPPRPRWPEVPDDDRPRLTPPTTYTARLEQQQILERVYGQHEAGQIKRLQELADTVRCQHGVVNDRGEWVSGSLPNLNIDRNDPKPESPA